MKALQEHMIGTQSGTWPLLEWVAEQSKRNRSEFDLPRQLEWAKKVAEVDCPKSRKLLLTLMSVMERQHNTIEEMRRESDTIAAALNKIDKNNP